MQSELVVEKKTRHICDELRECVMTKYDHGYTTFKSIYITVFTIIIYTTSSVLTNTVTTTSIFVVTNTRIILMKQCIVITIYKCIENKINTSEITVNSALANERTEGRVFINVVTTIPEVDDIIKYF